MSGRYIVILHFEEERSAEWRAATRALFDGYKVKQRIGHALVSLQFDRNPTLHGPSLACVVSSRSGKELAVRQLLLQCTRGFSERKRVYIRKI